MKDQIELPANDISPPLYSLIFEAAIAFHQKDQFEQAEALYRAVLALNSGHADACYNLGLIYQGQQKWAEAIIAYRDAIFARLDYADAYGNLGTILKEQGKHAEALILYQQATAYDPTNAVCYSNYGVLLNDLGRSDEALTAFRLAVAYRPDYEWSYVNMASTLLNLGYSRESVLASQHAAALLPDQPTPLYNLGASLKTLNLLDDAVAALRQAVALAPTFGEAHFALGQILLMQGKFEEGWEEYDWRWSLQDYAWLSNIHGPFEQPRWRGEPLRNKTILIYAEQGLGDAIQYARYLPRVLEMGAKIVVAVHPPVKPLFDAIGGMTVVGLDEAFPEFDVHCPLLGLPQIFKTTLETVPADIPYLQADPLKVAKWKDRLGSGGLKVGIVWAGNPTQKGDRWRSPRLAAVAPLFDVPGVKFFALQKGPGREDMTDHPLPSHVVDLGDQISDFSDTAAIMAGLDLVVTSCTAPLHLAGALGVPTWAIIPFAPHFLWQLERSDSPWYPTLRLYRQDIPGKDWSEVVARVASDLARLARI